MRTDFPRVLLASAAVIFAAGPAPAQVFPNAAVATDHEIASNAGAEILAKGGNAVDAAVAASLTLSVVRPESCGIGGGGFMLIRLIDDPRHGSVSIALNYRETAPEWARPHAYLSLPAHAATTGGAAVAVPGTIAGLCHALEKYGTLDRGTVFAPAIRAAEQGWIVDDHYARSSREAAERRAKAGLEANPTLRLPHETDKPDGGAIAPGTRVTNPDHARALRLIAEQGPDAFYRGEIADAIVAAVNAAGGTFTRRDLSAFTVQEVTPVEAKFMGRAVLSMPPPSSGGIAAGQILGMLDVLTVQLDAARKAGHNSAPYLHLFAEASKHAFADRARWLSDAGDGSVALRLLDPVYIRARAYSIETTQTLPHADYGTLPPPPEDGGTSHLCVVDSKGNAVACTETINLEFGSVVRVPGFGFILNNQMDDFTTRPGEPNAFGLIQSAQNAPAPGKRPLSSMTPIIILDSSRKVELIAGASGGPRIISGTVQATLNSMLWGMPAQNAVAAPRAHHQWLPDALRLEPAIFDSPANDALRALGHTTERTSAVGCVQLIRRTPQGWDAGCDPRKGGKPAGN